MKRGNCGSSGSVSSKLSQQSMLLAAAEPRQPPNPTHDGGLHCPPVFPSGAHFYRADTLAQR
jgi:hypothetical protein